MTSNGSPTKKSITLAGHRTSISLEPVFWELLAEYAKERSMSIGGVVGQIDEARDTNLSSAIRVFLTKHLIAQVKAQP